MSARAEELLEVVSKQLEELTKISTKILEIETANRIEKQFRKLKKRHPSAKFAHSRINEAGIEEMYYQCEYCHTIAEVKHLTLMRCV